MTKDPIEQLIDVLLTLGQSDNGQGVLPLYIVHQHLRVRVKDFDGEQVIQEALRKGLVDKVVDYERVDEGPSPLHPSWHLKRLTPEETQERLQLNPIEWALLDILWAQNDPDFPGQLPVEEVKQHLIDRRFSEEEIQYVAYGIGELVGWYLAYDNRRTSLTYGKDLQWLGIIEEAERHPSPEYLEAQRKADEEFLRKLIEYEMLVEELEKECDREKANSKNK
jgi:hypothetical protein